MGELPLSLRHIHCFTARNVKVRIVCAPSGEIDGMSVDHLVEHATYNLSSSLATLLICEGYAQPAEDEMGGRESTNAEPGSLAADRKPPRQRP